MVSLVSLLPLFITLLVCVSAMYYVYRRKSLAQSVCVQQAARIENDLKTPLKKLLKMNRQAQSLRLQRAQADANANAATASAYPPAIAAAQAQRTAVIARQMMFQAEQLALLMEAQRLRDEGQVTLRGRVRPLEATGVQSLTYYIRPLAVTPNPPFDLSPDYETVPDFKDMQQHRFRYSVDLLAGFPGMNEVGASAPQMTECSVTLKSGEEDEWDLQILTAKAP